VHLII